ncbi:MAG TPA: MaoC/PaaZ C-terminal domain-containing protein [Acidimicrobiales bacterium]|jgi:acyl dehydratase|nr:MaoC/PaaZ C-terminal domain-containing protein [Acidimicrobiales bacterium]
MEQSLVLDTAKVGSRHGPDSAVVDPERARAYAAATNDDLAAYQSGPWVPPVFGVVLTWPTMMAAVLDVVPPAALKMLVHLAQDMRFPRPLAAGQTLVTSAEVSGIRSRRSGAEVTVAVTSRGDDGALALEQFATMFIRGMAPGDSAGELRPDHALPAGARSARVTERVLHVDPDQTFRYRDASGDDNPIHVDEAAAKEAGLPGIILHGLCTMAMCSHVVVSEVVGGEPSALRRLAVRFSRPVVPGTDLVTTVYDLGELGGGRSYGFEAQSQGHTVVKDGRAEVGETPCPS